MHDPRHIANKFIERGNARGNPFTHLQIQKLVYFAHAWMLALHGRPLINKQFEAWKLGPVERSIYNSLSARFRGNPVRPAISFPSTHEGGEAPCDPEEEHVLDQVCTLYGDYDGFALSTLSHAPGTPWQQTQQNNIIPDEAIRQYYTSLDCEEDLQMTLIDGAPPIWSQSAVLGRQLVRGMEQIDAGECRAVTLEELRSRAHIQ